MYSLCITGPQGDSLHACATLLQHAGAQPAMPCGRDASITMAAWQQQVLGSRDEQDGHNGHNGHNESSDAPIISRVWEQLATELFLANHQQPLWYWADTRSTRLLSYWHGFEHNILFVLLHSAPSQVLAHAIANGAHTPEQLAEVLQHWQLHTQQMLRFHLRHPERSLLLDSQLLNTPERILETLTQR